MSLADLAEQIAATAKPSHRIEIPLWQALGIPEAPPEGEDDPHAEQRAEFTLCWHRPDVAEMEYLKHSVQALGRNYPHWTPELMHNVALMAQCHVKAASDGIAPLDFYAGIVEGEKQNADIWYYLKTEMVRRFPQICLPEDILQLASVDNEFAISLGVNASQGIKLETIYRLGELTLKHLQRHVSECVGIPSTAIADLQAIEEGQHSTLEGVNALLSEFVTAASGKEGRKR
jgi:hypothetical protein